MAHSEELERDPGILLVMPAGERRRLLSVVLQGFSYAPFPCSTSEDLSRLIAALHPRAAVVDLRMEQGFQLCELIRQGSEVPILGLTDPSRQAMPRLSLPVDMVRMADAPIEEILLALRQLVIGRAGPPGSAAGRAAGEARS